MQLATRNVLNHAFSGLGCFAIAVVALALLVLIIPIAANGVGAFAFTGTVEWRRLQFDRFQRGGADQVAAELAAAAQARAPVYAALAKYESDDLPKLRGPARREARDALAQLKDLLRELLGPIPGEPEPNLERLQYGATRMTRAREVIDHILYESKWVQTDPTRMAELHRVPRVAQYKGGSLEPLFAHLERDADAMLRPRFAFYPQFLTDRAIDSHVFGGIWAEVVGTLMLTVGAVLFAVPLGVISAIYLVEYTKGGLVVGFLRSCISTLAGVPSIVFGLFGLAFFINTVGISPGKSVLAGALTLALLILPVIIRASEEAIRAVPRTYKEAALSLGAGAWRTVLTVILPASLPGILTGIVISMGRAAGETAPIIFTAAVSVGGVVALSELATSPTPALPWNIYNLCTEHEAANKIRHVQYGMVLTLVLLVLLLNAAAIWLRARIARRLAG